MAESPWRFQPDPFALRGLDPGIDWEADLGLPESETRVAARGAPPPRVAPPPPGPSAWLAKLPGRGKLPAAFSRGAKSVGKRHAAEECISGLGVSGFHGLGNGSGLRGFAGRECGNAPGGWCIRVIPCLILRTGKFLLTLRKEKQLRKYTHLSSKLALNKLKTSFTFPRGSCA